MSNAGRRHVPGPKYYVIFCTADVLIYPIKSRINPYPDGRKWSYPGQPQFFGGESKPGEKVIDTLIRETFEESAQTYLIFGYVDNPPIFADAYFHRSSRTMVSTTFYQTYQFIGFGPWPDENIWAARPPEYQEMCWIAKIDRIAFNQNMTDLDVSLLLLQNARQDPRAKQWSRDLMATELSGEYKKSHTFHAFGEFVREWCKVAQPQPAV